MFKFALFIFNNVLAVYVCLNMAYLLFREEGRYFRLWISLVLFPVLALFCILLAGSLGILNTGSIIVILCVLILLLTIYNNEFASMLLMQLKSVKIIHAGAMVSVAVLLMFLLGRHVLNGTVMGVDGLSYHASYGANIIRSGSVFLPKIGLQDFFPYNAEILSAWFMLPFRNDALVFMAPSIWYVIILSSVFHFIYMLSRSLRMSLLGVVLCGLSSPILKAHASFSAVDLAAPAMILIAVIFLFYHMERSPCGLSRFLILSGLASGYACGTKVSFVLVCIALPIFAVTLFRQKCRTAFLLIPTGFILSMLPTCGFWYIRNFLETLNPLFPAQVAFFDGPLDKAYLKSTTIFYQLFNSPQPLNDWKYLLDALVRWPISFFIISLLGYAMALASYFMSADKWKKPFLFLLTLIGLLFFLNHLFTPFSGANHTQDPVFRIELRFLILSFLLGILLFCSSCHVDSRLEKIGFILCLIAVFFKSGFTVAGVAFSAALLAVILAAPYFWDIVKVKLSAFTHELPIIFLSLAVLAGLSMAYPAFQDQIDRKIFGHRQEDVTVGLAWKDIENLPDGSIITWFGSPYSYQRYPYFGRNLNYCPVIVNGDGSVRKELYLRWEESGRRLKWFDWLGHSPARETLVDNLIENNIEYVIVVMTSSQTWPSQKETLDKDPRSRVFSNGEFWVIYKLACNGINV